MMRNILIALIVLVIASCNRETETSGFVVKGKITNLNTNQVVIQELTPMGLVFIDSSTVSPDGSFELNGNITERTFCVIQTPHGSAVLVVDSMAEIILNIDATHPEDFTVTGSSETERLKKLLALNHSFMVGMKSLDAKYSVYGDEIPPVKVQVEMRAAYDSVLQARKKAVEANVLALENSIVPYFATNYNYLIPDPDFEFLKQVDTKLYPSFMQSKYGSELHKRVENLGRTAVGSIAPDIVLQDPFGKTLSLSGLRGKTVLIDFWASWCGPCRQESPNLVKVYNKYKSRGFEIFSVSLDDNRDSWQKAINDDKLLWTHVSDLMKFNSPVVNLYSFDAIPFTVLIDGEGRIIAKGLRGNALDEKLAEVLK